MKLLGGLNELLRNFDGEPIRVTTKIDDCPKCGHHSEEANEWTIADVLLNIISQSRLAGKDSIVLYELGLTIHKNCVGSDVQLEDHPFELLKQEVDGFSGFTLAVIAPVRRVLDKADKNGYLDVSVAQPKEAR